MLAINEHSLIGSPVINPRTLETGHVVAVKPVDSPQYLIGAAMTQIHAHCIVVYASGRKAEIPDCEAAAWIEAATAKGLPYCENPLALLDASDAETAKAQARGVAARSEYEASRDSHRAEFATRCPAWAKAVIYAVQEIDDCDAMSDYFNVKTGRRVVLGYSRHTRDLFPELRNAAATFPETAHLATAPADAEHREKWSMGAGYYLKATGRYSSGWKVCKRTIHNGAPPFDCAEFPTPVAAPVPAETAEPGTATASGMTVERHTHTKKGFEMYICILPDRVDRARFETLRANCEAMGGWYSRPWGRTPGGFAFKDAATAEAFTGGDAAPVPAERAEAPNAVTAARHTDGMADKLERLADAMQPNIDAAFRDRLENTPKRAKQGAMARLDGEQWRRAQRATRALAALHRAGTVPAELATVSTKSRLFELAASRIDRSRAGYYDAGICTGKPYSDKPDALAFWGLAGGKSAEQVKADAIRDAVAALQFANIDGFFPTPPDLAKRMADLSDIGDGMNVLEPSAGSGNLCDAVAAACPGADIVAIEINSRLAELLRLKGHDVLHADFMAAAQFSYFDRVVMNPPFERGQDIDHVRRAFDWLKPDGRLVAVMSPGTFYRNDGKATEFRTWFDSVGGDRSDLPAGTFKTSGTNVAAVLVEIRKG